MRVQVMPCGGPGFALTGFVLNKCFAVDAGPLGTVAAPAELSAIENILLTHSHIDHVAGLPVFLDSVYGLMTNPPKVHATPPTLESLQRDVFNGRLMPDFIGMSALMNPFLCVNTLAEEGTCRIGPFEVTTFPVMHTVPTIACLVDDGKTAVAFITDTSPVLPVVRRLATHPRLRAVFLEASFPNRLSELASISHHMTSQQFCDSVALLPSSVTAYPIHVKPRFVEEIEEEIRSARLPNVKFVCTGDVIEL